MKSIKKTIERLKEGNIRFVDDKLDNKFQNTNSRESLIDNQNPYAIVLSCADSRVVPELIFDTGLGELFVIRVGGNIANISSIASIEYAIANIGSKVIIILGHQNCKAVETAINDEDLGQNLNHLLSHIAPAIKASKKDASINDVVKKNVALTSDKLYNNSSTIKNTVDNGDLKIVTAYYNLNTGKVDFL
jgi:carbonic anhydrase